VVAQSVLWTSAARTNDDDDEENDDARAPCVALCDASSLSPGAPAHALPVLAFVLSHDTDADDVSMRDIGAVVLVQRYVIAVGAHVAAVAMTTRRAGVSSECVTASARDIVFLAHTRT
jgi:hypothetical protein